MKIAVIGSGISGLSSAWLLARRHAVHLYEAETRLGGHTHTVEVPLADGRVQPVDTGWIVYNGLNYPNLTALFGELGVQTRPTSMSFGVSLGGGAYEWTGSDQLWTVFAQPSNLLRPRHLRLLIDILRLNRKANALLRSGRLPDGSLGQWLDTVGFSRELAARYLLPMAGLIWSCSPRKAMEYPAADFMRFFDSHSLFTATGQPTWYTVIGGSHQYVKKLQVSFQGELRLGQAVRAVRREAEGGLVVETANSRERYDQVVLATHADTSLRLLPEADAETQAVLAGIPYNASRCVLHTDTRFLPRRRRAWASWNYVNAGVDPWAADLDAEIHDRPISGSYWMNRLQGIEGPVQYVVTLNPEREIPRDQVILDTTYHHPHYGAGSVLTHERLPAVQGRGGLWLAGAWAGYGFHEDGLKSGLRVVQGLDPDCLPGWAVLGKE
ncbi:MAG TPA: FAD-dependent oxidoreductase [Nevskiaceae bacterium]|nr:FAD-dependent oxidoreductase [Nevskiaceae bacterium]